MQQLRNFWTTYSKQSYEAAYPLTQLTRLLPVMRLRARTVWHFWSLQWTEQIHRSSGLCAGTSRWPPCASGVFRSSRTWCCHFCSYCPPQRLSGRKKWIFCISRRETELILVSLQSLDVFYWWHGIKCWNCSTHWDDYWVTYSGRSEPFHLQKKIVSFRSAGLAGFCTCQQWMKAHRL